MTKKNEILKQYTDHEKSQTNYKRLQKISNSLTETIRSFKEKLYYNLSTKLANPSTSSKTYSANNVSLYKIIVLSQNLIRIIPKTGLMMPLLTMRNY